MAARRLWTQAHVRRLFWRAGFGATRHEARHWARAGKPATLRHLLRTRGRARLVGPPPRIHGHGLDPANEWGHDVLWWLDRMVRTTQPLEEKMVLFWHDHFATAEQDTPLMLRQNRTLRRHALGSFPELLHDVTKDPAMLLFLSLADSDPKAPNENYARELMELFTLGHGYTERDIRQASRALTGFRVHWRDPGPPRTYYDRHNHDRGVKRIFGRRGRFDWTDVLHLVVHHPRHAPFLVEKLWDYFVAMPLDRHTRRRLVRIYRGSHHRIKPVVAAILAHPALYRHLDGPDMVKCPIVWTAGAIRATGNHVSRDSWAYLMGSMGQMPFDPPSVAGWEWGTAWMSSNAMKVRHRAVNELTEHGRLHVGQKSTPTSLSPRQAVRRARRAAGDPWASEPTLRAAHGLARHMLKGSDKAHDWQDLHTRADMVQRTLRQLFLAGPDAQVH